jgi:hypothetical protein
MDKRIRAKKDYTPHIKTLAMLFREILELIPAKDAEKVVDGYQAGAAIELLIWQSSYGSFCKTAFRYRLVQDWRKPPDDTVN